jgi:hypothetical protein
MCTVSAELGLSPVVTLSFVDGIWVSHGSIFAMMLSQCCITQSWNNRGTIVALKSAGGSYA